MKFLLIRPGCENRTHIWTFAGLKTLIFYFNVFLFWLCGVWNLKENFMDKPLRKISGKWENLQTTAHHIFPPFTLGSMKGLNGHLAWYLNRQCLVKSLFCLCRKECCCNLWNSNSMTHSTSNKRLNLGQQFHSSLKNW